jgi:O-antigen ligase
MSEQIVADRGAINRDPINRAAARLCTFVVAGTAGMVLTLTAYSESFSATHVGPVLAGLIVLHLLWHRRFFWCREFALYAYFVLYMVIALLWTHDTDLAMNTLAPAVNGILVMILFGSLIIYHNIPTLLAGALFGFAVGAAYYTLTQGFPFSYPQDFSYNAIAGMYLFGLFITLMYGCFGRSSGIFVIAIAPIIMLHIVATTSIKTNLGILLGLLASAIMYFRHFGRLFRRKILLLVLLASALALAVASNDALVDKLGRGAQRVSVGVQVLENRDDVAGYSAFAKRDYWKHAGIEGWKLNPVFGYGVEAFRHDYGITSHSTPIDLLYNSGLIGLILFYAIFASLFWRLLQLDEHRFSGQRSLMFAGVVCYVFVSLSGTVHYNSFLACFVGISSALLASRGRAPRSTPGNQGVSRQ